MMRNTDIHLEYQPPIVSPPIAPQSMHQATTMGDAPTIEFWKDIWVRNMESNKKIFGSFKDKGLHNLYRKYDKLPVIVMGAGPSLKHYAKYLTAFEENGVKFKGNPGILVMSCLHNFAYLTDLGVHVDYWVTLDGGEVVIDEMFDGGTQPREFYKDKSKGQQMIAYVGTNPRLWDNWKGDVIWTQSVMPNQELKKKMEGIEKYEMITSSGGNVLGASMYIAKAIFGCNPVIFMGADFSFSYDKKFHSFDSKYDQMGQVIKVRDIYGNAVHTWQSYYGFKQWMDMKAMSVPGVYINCSDGCMGAYENGNIVQIMQRHINDALEMYRVVDHLGPTIQNVDTIENGLVIF